MIMTISMAVGFLVVQILCFIFFIIVLVKLFKKEGALKGILGFFCGIYTFIWGWMKHKELAMTKVMALWSILTVASMVLVPMMGVGSALEMQKYIQTLAGNADIKLAKMEPAKKADKTTLARKPKTEKNAKNPAKPKSVKKETASNTDWSQKAMALWKNGKYKDPNKAVDYLGQAITATPKSAEVYNNRGLAYYNLKLYQKAIDDYNQAIELDPGQVAAYNNRGNAYYELTDYEMALADFNQSLLLDQNYATAHLNRGLAYYQMDQNEKACADFQKACDLGDCEGIKWAAKNGVCK